MEYNFSLLNSIKKVLKFLRKFLVLNSSSTFQNCPEIDFDVENTYSIDREGWPGMKYNQFYGLRCLVVYILFLDLYTQMSLEYSKKPCKQFDL